MPKKNNIIIIGNGQIGSALAELYGEQAVQLTREDIDFSIAGPRDYLALCAKYQPDIIINTVAYTKVDQAETERELARHVNGTAAGLLAAACKEYGALLIHYSTDYVFSGKGQAPWAETDVPAPINHYGATKLWGEQLIASSGCKYIILRISWVYDADHHNFLNSMLRLAAQKESLSIVDDQIGAPSYACGIAGATKQLIDKLSGSEASGIYHLSYGGCASWKEFAEAIFAHARARGAKLSIQTISAISTANYESPAVRPLNSRLDCSKLRDTFGIELPDWQDGLKSCLEVIYAR